MAVVKAGGGKQSSIKWDLAKEDEHNAANSNGLSDNPTHTNIVAVEIFHNNNNNNNGDDGNDDDGDSFRVFTAQPWTLSSEGCRVSGWGFHNEPGTTTLNGVCLSSR